MDGSPEVVGTVAVIVVTAVLSGPVVGLDLTSPDEISGESFGEGDATVGNVTLPETLAIERGEFGAGSYYLRVSPATVELDEVTGRPILDYAVSIDDLGVTRSTIHIVSAEQEGRYELTLSTTSFDPDEITRERYDGSVTIKLRSGEDEVVLADEDVTFEVVE